LKTILISLNPQTYIFCMSIL